MGESVTQQLLTRVQGAGRAALDLIFPPSCVGCGASGSVWCRTCDAKRQPLRGPRCLHCGSVVRGIGRNCRWCDEYPSSIRVRSCCRYQPPVSRALLHLKYRPNRRLASVLGGWLAEAVQSANWNPDLIVPVPLGSRRRSQRGFNQAGLLAVACARELGAPCDEGFLVRWRETASQVGLDAGARLENVHNAFRANRDANGAWIVVVDDLYTTGATLRACGRALLEVGAVRVCGLTVARAVHRADDAR